jgi:hypothetical protein
MIAWIAAGTRDSNDGSHKDSPAASPVTAHFSHTCLKPFIGKDRICPQFGGCLICPGLVVPLDAEHLARVLQAKQALEKARDRIDPYRWSSIYAPSYHVLAADILPDFALELHPVAEQIVPTLPPLPELE